jgi:ubiquinone biosynthesis monooxygenase Coq7
MKSLVDKVIGELDVALRVVGAPAQPAAVAPEPSDEALTARERNQSAALMRVNHAGEIAAQALYRGQASICREPALRQSLLKAAEEEHQHLVWCETRVKQLGGHTSRLAAVWYAGAFSLGSLAGLAGDRISLGFLAETERQVANHLAGHLQRLPEADQSSREIVARMQTEEIAHGESATARGAAELPQPVTQLMAAAAKVMTTLAQRI